MRNLIYLFLRYGGFFTFLFLEVVSFFLIIQYNQEQNRIFAHSLKQFTGQIDEQSREIEEFFRLRSERDSIASENARLKSILGLTRFDKPITSDSIENIKDSLIHIYREALVVNNSFSLSNNYLTINKGSEQGVTPRMGVIGLKGIVGIVRNVSKDYALVMSILHRQARVSASLKKSGHFGSLIWKGDDLENFYMEDIPQNANPQRGDTVITNGFSTHFPPNIVIGTVDTTFAESGSSFISARINLINDPGNTRFVYVIEKRGKEEQLSLEQEIND
jgi:rod shape-determining protein MreC